MRIAHRELVEEEKKPIGMRKSEARRSKDRVFPLMEERKSTGIGLTNPMIREEGSSQIRIGHTFGKVTNPHSTINILPQINDQENDQ